MTNEEMAQVLEKHRMTFRHGTDIERALKAGAAALRAMAWKPIADAPKDGTSVLIVNDRGIHVAQFETKKTHGDAHMPWWYVNDGKSNLRAIRGSEPTHYRALPAPPEDL